MTDSNPYESPEQEHREGGLSPSLGATIEVSGRISPDDATQALKLYGPQFNLRLLVIIGFASAFPIAVVGDYDDLSSVTSLSVDNLVSAFVNSKYLPMAIIVVVLGYFEFALRRSKHARLRAYEEERGEYALQKVTFDDRGVQIDSADVDNAFRWNAFAEFACNDEFLLLFVTSNASYVIIPRNWFENESDWARLVHFVENRMTRAKPQWHLPIA